MTEQKQPWECCGTCEHYKPYTPYSPDGICMIRYRAERVSGRRTLRLHVKGSRPPCSGWTLKPGLLAELVFTPFCWVEGEVWPLAPHAEGWVADSILCPRCGWPYMGAADGSIALPFPHEPVRCPVCKGWEEILWEQRILHDLGPDPEADRMFKERKSGHIIQGSGTAHLGAKKIPVHSVVSDDLIDRLANEEARSAKLSEQLAQAQKRISDLGGTAVYEHLESSISKTILEFESACRRMNAALLEEMKCQADRRCPWCWQETLIVCDDPVDGPGQGSRCENCGHTSMDPPPQTTIVGLEANLMAEREKSVDLTTKLDMAESNLRVKQDQLDETTMNLDMAKDVIQSVSEGQREQAILWQREHVGRMASRELLRRVVADGCGQCLGMDIRAHLGTEIAPLRNRSGRAVEAEYNEALNASNRLSHERDELRQRVSDLRAERDGVMGWE